MSETANNPFIAAYSDSVEFERIPDGMYPAVICGIVTRNFPDYNDKSKLVTKIQFITQVSHDGATYYNKTKPFTPFVAEKSNLMVWLGTACGATMAKIKEKYPNGFPLESLVGVPVQAVITTVTGKDGKDYSELANTLKAAKGQKTKIVPDAIPAYLVRGAVNYYLGEGLTVKEDTAVTAPAQPSKQPFGGAKQGAAPSAPAGAFITQSGNAAAFMGMQAPTVPGLSVTQPAPEPAPAAPADEDDSDSDLPF